MPCPDMNSLTHALYPFDNHIGAHFIASIGSPLRAWCGWDGMDRITVLSRLFCLTVFILEMYKNGPWNRQKSLVSSTDNDPSMDLKTFTCL